MNRERQPFEGVWNIIRFNYHFYILSFVVLMIIGCLYFLIPSEYSVLIIMPFCATLITTLNSLLVSFYIYDISDLYKLNWLEKIKQISSHSETINIHAGFDETSHLLAQKFPHSNLSVFDFYDAKKHTEVSIKRARKVYPAYPNTQQIQTNYLPLSDKSIDVVFLFLAAHEIRNKEERTQFFQELKRICKDNGQIILIEHLRDIPNFLAYTIGFLHFLSAPTWLKNFKEAELKILQKFKITSFITVFILKP